MDGLYIELRDGFAEIAFLDPSKRGATLANLIAVAGPEFVEVDTSGTRKTYRVPESVARDAGVLPPEKAPEPAPVPTARKRKTAKPKVAE